MRIVLLYRPESVAVRYGNYRFGGTEYDWDAALSRLNTDAKHIFIRKAKPWLPESNVRVMQDRTPND